MPGWGLTVLLPQAIGVRRAREMSFTGNFLSAEEALHFGLVNHVVAHDDLLPFTRSLAADIIGNDQDGVRQIRATYAAITHDDDALGAGGARRPGVAAHDVQPRQGGRAASRDPAPRPDAVTTCAPSARRELRRRARTPTVEPARPERRTRRLVDRRSASSSPAAAVVADRSCTATATPRATTSRCTCARPAACSTATSPRSSPTTASPSSTPAARSARSPTRGAGRCCCRRSSTSGASTTTG